MKQPSRASREGFNNPKSCSFSRLLIPLFSIEKHMRHGANNMIQSKKEEPSSTDRIIRNKLYLILLALLPSPLLLINVASAADTADYIQWASDQAAVTPHQATTPRDSSNSVKNAAPAHQRARKITLSPSDERYSEDLELDYLYKNKQYQQYFERLERRREIERLRRSEKLHRKGK